jgi:hypothetical protein
MQALIDVLNEWRPLWLFAVGAWAAWQVLKVILEVDADGSE